MRRVSKIVAAVALLSATSLAGVPARADTPAKEHGDKMSKSLLNCLNECAHCMGHCARLVGEGKTDHLATMKLCDDCAEVCFLTLKMHSSRSKALHAQADACAKICDVCAAACEKHSGDAMMKRCAQACRDCAAACREMHGGSKSASAR